MTSLPLSGLRVIELAHIMAGPVCGLMLADLGADVIKVERVPDGDPARRMVPPTQGSESAAFMMMNRNKRGVAVNLKHGEGQRIARRLLSNADVVIENFRIGTMERFGLSYEVLKEANPKLIYCAISGFGRTGPYAGLGGFDLIAQGYSGLMSVTGEGPDRPRVKCGAPLTDITAGILGAMGILAACVQRTVTGEGQLVDTSLFEAGITQTYWQSAIALATGVAPMPMGTAHPLSAPYESFETADGAVNIGASSDASWERLPEALGLPELSGDPRFKTNADRMKHRAELSALVSAKTRTDTTANWVAALEAAGVPAGPVLDVNEMLRHPQTHARDMVTTVPHRTLGTVHTLGCPVKIGDTRLTPRCGAPILGEHTRDVLKEAGYAEAEIDRLIEDGAAFAPDR